MKSNFYWFKVGLFIGLGFLVAYWLGSFLGLFLITSAIFFPLLSGIVLLALFVAFCGRFLGRTINRIQGDLRLRQGWADRARR
jgi:hypothetical protein